MHQKNTRKYFHQYLYYIKQSDDKWINDYDCCVYTIIIKIINWAVAIKKKQLAMLLCELVLIVTKRLSQNASQNELSIINRYFSLVELPTKTSRDIVGTRNDNQQSTICRQMLKFSSIDWVQISLWVQLEMKYIGNNEPTGCGCAIDITKAIKNYF